MLFFVKNPKHDERLMPRIEWSEPHAIGIWDRVARCAPPVAGWDTASGQAGTVPGTVAGGDPPCGNGGGRFALADLVEPGRASVDPSEPS